MGRQSENDVADIVNVESTAAVREEVKTILQRRYPKTSFAILDTVFEDFKQLFTGNMPGYLACDTAYHDMRHTLEVTLAMTRLIDGHDRVACAPEQLGAQRALLGVVVALLHDAGYIRETGDGAQNGAAYTRVHVSRSAAYLARYLPSVSMASTIETAEKLVHFTGYEIEVDKIGLGNPLDRRLGCMLGSADLIGQMSDRCYLEKCRDFLYQEFMHAGIAQTLYRSPEDLLRKTVDFYQDVALKRLDDEFEGVHRVIAAHFSDHDPYSHAIGQHINYLRKAVDDNAFERLRRNAHSCSASATLDLPAPQPSSAQHAA